MNDLIQWICVAVILAIAVSAAIRGIIRAIRAGRACSDDPGCACSCGGCPLTSECDKKSRSRRKRHIRRS